MKLTRDQARDLAYGEGDPELNLTVELNEQVGSSRWSSLHRLIVKDRDGKYWETSYQQGLTESQDEQAFEDQDEVEFSEVEKYPVTAYEYRPLTAGATLSAPR